MELKYAVDFANKKTTETIIAGVSLGILGLITAGTLADLTWFKEISATKLVLYVLLTMVTGTYIHEGYHWCIAKLMGYRGTLQVLPLPLFVPTDYLTKWGALAIKVSPGTDLTLMSCLIISFLPSPLNPILMIFLVGNLAGSGNDFLQAYYIFKLAGPESRIRLTQVGFEIWE